MFYVTPFLKFPGVSDDCACSPMDSSESTHINSAGNHQLWVSRFKLIFSSIKFWSAHQGLLCYMFSNY